jgi:type I restriction enzyme S subunit
MSAVEGWKNKRLSDLAEYINGYAFKPDDWEKDGLPIIRIEQLKNPHAPTDYYSGKLPAKNIIENGDLIFSWSASLFLRIWENGRAALNQHLFRVVEKEGVDRIFLKLFIEFYLSELTKASHGSTMQHITRKELDRFGAPLPASKPEQTKIAEILSTVDRAIEQTEALIDKQQRIKTGLMQDLLTRGIDEHGNLRSEQTHKFKNSLLGRIPVEWKVEKLKSLSRGGAKNGFFKKPELVGSGYKLINVSEIYQPFGIDTNRDSVERVNATPSDLLKYGAMEGDLFFTRSSLVLEGIARCNIIRAINEPTLFECHVMRVQPDKTKIVPEFLALECQSYLARLFLMSRAKHVTMTTISQPELEELNVPMPSSLEEQHIIVDTALSNDRAIRCNEMQRSKLQRIKTAMMQDLLTGKRRITPLLGAEATH